MRNGFAQATEDQNEENAVEKQRRDGYKKVEVETGVIHSRFVRDDANPSKEVNDLTKKLVPFIMREKGM